MRRPATAWSITLVSVIVTSDWMLSLMRSRSMFAARMRCLACSARNASSRACSTSAFDPLDRDHRAMAVALMHNASDITMNMIADANAAGVAAREYAGRE